MDEFFATLPEAGAALWDFMDGFYGLAITVGSIVLVVGLLSLAKVLRPNHEWLSAISGMTGVAIAFWWAFGIMPSAFTFFMDGNRDLFEGRLLPEALPAMENVYAVLRDVIVMGMQTVFVVAFALGMAVLQKRYPRSLAPGEEKSPATGGYK